ncbi:MAG TPA: hypothetical protein VF627_11845 [Abditibacterium sp.]|jgi:hypothetical protein
MNDQSQRNYWDQLQDLPAPSGPRHSMAVFCPLEGWEKAFVKLLSGWLRYADAHQAAYKSGIGADYVLGPAWAGIGSHLLTLLNGSLGRLDPGTLDSLIRRILQAEKFDPDTL